MTRDRVVTRGDMQGSTADESSFQIVLIEDDPSDRVRLIRHIRKGWNGEASVTICRDLEQAVRVIPRAKPSVVIADFGLPDSTGSMTVARLLALLPVPIVMVSGRATLERARETVSLGAHAMLSKADLNPATLRLAVEAAIVSHQRMDKGLASVTAHHVNNATYALSGGLDRLAEARGRGGASEPEALADCYSALERLKRTADSLSQATGMAALSAESITSFPALHGPGSGSDVPPKVLIVDDEHMVCRAIKRSLGRDYDVHVAHDGREALKLCETHEFDAIVSDVVMPGMSGTAFFEALPPRLQARVVFISGAVIDDGMEDVLRNAGRPLLVKPVPQERLRETVAHITDGAAATMRERSSYRPW